MPDEMVAPAELGGDLVRLPLEVDARQWRPRRIAAAREEDALVPLVERTLRRPRRRGVPDASVNEHDARHKRHVTWLRKRNSTVTSYAGLARWSPPLARTSSWPAPGVSSSVSPRP